MRILLVHNESTPPSEANDAFAAEARLLEANGHDVDRLTVASEAANGLGFVSLSRKAFWNKDVQADVRTRVRRMRAEVVHFHDTFPLVSPGAYYAAREEGAVVVQTVNDYRLLCANGRLYREKSICEECVGRKVGTPGVRHACYRNSRMASVAPVAMTALHNRMGTFADAVDLYLVPTTFARAKFLRSGLPGTRVMIKPHFVERDPGRGTHKGGYALYVGELSDEKGFRTVHEAWERVGKWVPLKVIGTGPLESLARDRVTGVEFLGRVGREEIVGLMKGAMLQLAPSNALETFSLTIVEGYATGLPAIATRHGALAELVPDGVTGLQFEPRNHSQLEAKVVWALKNAEEWEKIISNSRRAYEVKYNAARSHELLMEAYRRAMAARTGKIPEEALARV
jgi:glycosyltransferase involved in cell wall biosynthesis